MSGNKHNPLFVFAIACLVLICLAVSAVFYVYFAESKAEACEEIVGHFRALAFVVVIFYFRATKKN